MMILNLHNIEKKPKLKIIVFWNVNKRQPSATAVTIKCCFTITPLINNLNITYCNLSI